MSTSVTKAIVIGAGVSGLQIADLLLNKNIETIVLEAKDYAGGRVKETLTFADFPIELGGEEVHGEDSLHRLIAQEVGAEFIDESELNYFVEYEGTLYKDEHLVEKVPVAERVFQLDWEELVAYDKEEDIVLSEYINKYGFPENLHHAIDGIFGREWATDLDTLSVKGIKKWNVSWKYGEKNLLLKNMSNPEILRRKYKNVYDKVYLNTPVDVVQYNGEKGVSVKTRDGKSYTADIVIVSVPLSQLKNKKILFEPELPAEKVDAIQRVSMDPAMKIFLKFSRRFWDEDMGVLITTGVIRQTWESSCGDKTESGFVLTSLITGQAAVKLSSMEQKEAVNLLIADLKRVFNIDVEQLLESYLIQDWTKEEFIEGGYTYPNIKENDNTREIIAQPVDKKVYFVGEHVSKTCSLITGAIETSLDAFKEICKDHCLN